MLKVKDKLRRGETVTMAAVNWAAPALCEQLGGLGFDIAFIDCEKSAFTEERVEEMCRGARAGGLACVVRPWSADAGLISRYLDIGADGVMVAAVDTAEAAAALVAAVRYARWKDHDDKLVIAMIESPQAIDRLPSLLAVPGIDAWFVGPNDLAHRMGHPGQADHPAVQAAVQTALRSIAAAGQVAGALGDSPERLAAARTAGARLVMCRTRDLLAAGARAFHAQRTAPNPQPAA